MLCDFKAAVLLLAVRIDSVHLFELSLSLWFFPVDLNATTVASVESESRGQRHSGSNKQEVSLEACSSV